MLFAGVALAVALQTPSVQPQPKPRPCEQARASFASDAGTADLCAGEEALAAADARDDAERRRHWQTAADRLHRAVNAASATVVQQLALTLLVDAYDETHLDQPRPMEAALRDLMVLKPGDFSLVARLVRLLERQGLWEVAETTLLDARRQDPDAVDAYRQLAQFYARRVTAMVSPGSPADARAKNGPGGEPDAAGVYRVGGPITAPARLDVPQYPPEAKAADIAGVVVAEVLINPEGIVTDAKIVRSIPLLDDAALEAVRHWQFAPSIVNGVAVPVRMNVTVNFSPPR